jgi:hypothetical protein
MQQTTGVQSSTCSDATVKWLKIINWKDEQLNYNNNFRIIQWSAYKTCKATYQVKKSSKFTKKNHICRWYDDTQPYKISCPNSTSFIRYKNSKFQARKLSRRFVRNLLFLYLTNEVEFWQDVLQGCVSSYHLHMWFFFAEFRRLFYRGLHMSFHEGCGFHLICCQHVNRDGWYGGKHMKWNVLRFEKKQTNRY